MNRPLLVALVALSAACGGGDSAPAASTGGALVGVSILGNAKQNVVTDGALAVPDAGLPVPKP